MMFGNPAISRPALAAFCRSMARMLEAGVDIQKAIMTSAKQTSDRRLLPVAKDLRKAIRGGETLYGALRLHADRFPALMVDLAEVGERTGALPEVFSSLANYFELRIREQRDFRTAIAWPLFQLGAAILVIGLLIFILGMLPTIRDSSGNEVDLLGLGLSGSSGAMIWFGGIIGSLIAGWFSYTLLSRNFAGQTFLHPMLLRIPVLGHCMQSFAIARFSWCFSLTQMAGLSIRPSLDCSLRATGNGAFMMAEPHIWQELDEGETFADATAVSGLFPSSWLQIVETAEHTGTVPEELNRLSHIFEEDAKRALSRLTKIFAAAVWVCVAGIIIFFIFRVVMFYIGFLNDAANEALGV